MAEEQAGRALLRADCLVTRRDGLGCDITLTAGDRLGVLGASGSGKTAFLRTLAFLQAPIDGRLYWDEVNVTRKLRWLLGKRRFFVALLFANPYTSLEPWVSVREFLGKSHRISDVQAEYLQKSHIPTVATDGYVRSLSGVGRVRLALMVALQHDPRVVLVDDVFRMVVPEVWNLLFEELDAQVGETRGLIVASRFWQALTNTHYVFVLYKGNVVEWGPRVSILSQPRHPYTQWLLEQNVYSRSNVVKMDRQASGASFAGNLILEPREVAPEHWVRWR